MLIILEILLTFNFYTINNLVSFFINILLIFNSLFLIIKYSSEALLFIFYVICFGFVTILMLILKLLIGIITFVFPLIFAKIIC